MLPRVRMEADAIASDVTKPAAADPVRLEPEHPFGAPPTNLPSYHGQYPERVVGAPQVCVKSIDLNDARDRRRFLDVAAPFYAGDPHYIEPLRIERMHFLDPKKNIGIKQIEAQALIAYVDGRPQGRITAHVDHGYNRYHQARMGSFGFFECTNDPAVAHALLDAACTWLNARGCAEIIGPMSFNTNHQVGLLVENFARPPCIEMTYNPPYYEHLITSFGFNKAKDLYAWWIDVRAGLNNPKLQRMNRVAERAKRSEGVTFRTLDMKRFGEELTRLFELYNEAWQKNWGFVPLTRPEFDEIAKQLKPIVRKELIFIAEVRGRAVGFSVCLPDINELMPKNGRLFPLGWTKLAFGRRRIKYARLFTLGVIPEYRRRGLETFMMLETALRAPALGIEGGEVGWTLEDNRLINRAIEAMDAKLDRVYRLYGMTL